MKLIDPDRWQEILFILRQNRMRAILTAFGVFWGMYMLIVLMGVGNGLQKGTYESFGSIATNSVFIWPRSTTKPYNGLLQGRFFHFDNDDIRVLRQAVPEIEYLAPRCRIRGGENSVIHKDRQATVTVYGDYPDIQHIRLMKIEKGRFLNQHDINLKRKVAVIGYKAESLLFQPGEDPIAQTITIKGIPFLVVGVFRFTHPNQRDEKEDAKAVILPLSTFQHIYHKGDIVDHISLTAVPGVSASVVKDKLISVMARRHRVAPDDKRAFGNWNMEEDFRKVQNLFYGIRRLIWVVGLFTLLAGVVGVSSIMLITVKERTGEIGIKRAIGATPLDIIGQIITESVLLTSFSGYLGLTAGVLTLVLVNKVMDALKVSAEMFKNPAIDLPAALFALAAIILSGVLAGALPAVRALQIRPVEALRYKQ